MQGGREKQFGMERKGWTLDARRKAKGVNEGLRRFAGGLGAIWWRLSMNYRFGEGCGCRSSAIAHGGKPTTGLGDAPRSVPPVALEVAQRHGMVIIRAFCLEYKPNACPVRDGLGDERTIGTRKEERKEVNGVLRSRRRGRLRRGGERRSTATVFTNYRFGSRKRDVAPHLSAR